MGGRGECYRQGRGGAGRPGGRAVHLRGRLAQGPGPARPRHGQAAEDPGAQSGQHRGGEEQSKGPSSPSSGSGSRCFQFLILPSLAPRSHGPFPLHYPPHPILWLFFSLSRAHPSSFPCRPLESVCGLGYLEGGEKTLDSGRPLCWSGGLGTRLQLLQRQPAFSSLPLLDLW